MKRARVVGKLTYLRPLEREDLSEEYLDWLNDASVTRHILATGFPVTREGLEAYFEASQPPHAVMFAICDKETDRHIGNARLSQIDWIRRVALFGWILGPSEYRGRGYGSDALLLLLRYGFHDLGLNRIWSAIDCENEGSLGSVDKVGMTREGILRDFFYVDGRFRDGVALAMLRADFDRLYGGPETWRQEADPA